MREPCSPAVRRIIETALNGPAAPAATLKQAVAGRLLLLALIAEEEGRACQLLEAHGLARDVVVSKLGDQSDGRPLLLDRLLADARVLSRERDAEGTVTSEFFLIALLQSDEALGGALAAWGLDVAALVRAVLGDERPPLPVDDSLRLADEPGRLGAGRILDVNANRAREALRILDDFCRFERNDAYLTEEFKRLRHDLSGLLDSLPPEWLLASRETIQDVGTGIGAPAELIRSSPRDVARVNLKRLQEALRSLEEFGKIASATFAEGIEQLRYRSYTLEKALLLGDAARAALAEVRLYVLLTGARCAAALDWTIAEAAAGGAGMFQLREKELDDRELLARARLARHWAHQAGALFIVNDRPDIAHLAEADGVHLGQDDMPVHEARRILGPDALIGVSTHNLEQVRQAVLDGASYIGIGPMYSSTTKEFAELAGPEFVKAALAETSLPAFAIGGINLQTIDSAVAAGVRRVAVSSAIATAEEPRQAAQVIGEALTQGGRP